MKLNKEDLGQVVGGLVMGKLASARCVPAADGSGSVESLGFIEQESGADFAGPPRAGFLIWPV